MRNSETHTETIPFSNSAELYDLGMLEEMEDNEYLLDILNALLDESPKDLATMKEALHRSDTDVLCKKAHKLKSSSGIIRADRLTLLLTNIENLGKAGLVTAELTGLVEDALFEYNRVERSLNSYILKLK